MAAPLVLIVDDNENNRKLARDVLEFAGFGTLEATGGIEGVALAQEHLPDLVLMDIRMPDLRRQRGARKPLREDSRTAELPTVALTSSTMPRRRGAVPHPRLRRLPAEADQRARVPRPGAQLPAPLR